MTVPLIEILLATIGIALLVHFKLKGPPTAALLTKVGVSMLFILLSAWSATRPAVQEAGLGNLAFFIVGGLSFGLLGDIWLGLKSLHKDYVHLYMHAGICSFGIGHLFYLTGVLLFIGDGNFELLILPLLVAAAMAAFVYFIEKPLSINYGSYKRIVVLYTFILTAVTAFSLMLVFSAATVQPEFCVVFSTGITLFFLSDMVLSQTYFSKRAVSQKIYTPLNYLLYYSGQFLIAASLLVVTVS